MGRDGAKRKWSGRLFQSVGALAENALSRCRDKGQIMTRHAVCVIRYNDD